LGDFFHRGCSKPAIHIHRSGERPDARPRKYQRVALFFALGHVKIIAGELNSAGRPCRHDDCLLTEDDDADAADTYDSDTDAAAYGGDEL